jgi:hypothetical protein
MTIQQIIRLLKETVKRVEALEKAQVVPESVPIVTIDPVIVTPEAIEIPDAPVAFEGPRRGRPRKIVE